MKNTSCHWSVVWILLSSYLIVNSILATAILPRESPTVTSLAASQILSNPFPYEFPKLGTPGEALFPMEKCHGITLEEATIDQLQDYMSHGKLTSLQLAMCYMQRIGQTDGYIKYDLALL